MSRHTFQIILELEEGNRFAVGSAAIAEELKRVLETEDAQKVGISNVIVAELTEEA